MSFRSRLVLTLTGIGCAALTLTACTSSSGGAGETSPPATVTQTVTSAAPTPPPATTTSATPSTAPPAAQGCPPIGTGVPAGAASRPTIDVDGDGRPDTMWLDTATAPTLFGFVTASGATLQAQVSFAGGSQPSALAVDLRGDGKQILAFVGNSRSVSLLTVVNCALPVVLNPQGQPYTFDLGFAGNGTGVGCVDATGDGALDLVGLNIIRDAAGTATSVTTTVINVSGTSASNGATTTGPATAAALEAASSVSCGTSTYASSGLVPG